MKKTIFKKRCLFLLSIVLMACCFCMTVTANALQAGPAQMTVMPVSNEDPSITDEDVEEVTREHSLMDDDEYDTRMKQGDLPMPVTGGSIVAICIGTVAVLVFGAILIRNRMRKRY